jgi:hypothetical protein
VSRAGRAAARLALRLYPAAWRHRYGAELMDLVEESDGGVHDAADIARAAIREHMHGGHVMRFEPAHRHQPAFAAAAAAVLMPTFTVVALSLVGHELGVAGVASAVDPVLSWINGVPVVNLFLVAAPVAAFLLAVVPIVDLRMDGGDSTSAVAIRVGIARENLGVAAAAVLVAGTLAWHGLVEAVAR